MINLSSLTVRKINVRKLYIYFRSEIDRNFTKIKTILNIQKYMNSRTFTVHCRSILSLIFDDGILVMHRLTHISPLWSRTNKRDVNLSRPRQNNSVPFDGLFSLNIYHHYIHIISCIDCTIYIMCTNI